MKNQNNYIPAKYKKIALALALLLIVTGTVFFLIYRNNSSDRLLDQDESASITGERTISSSMQIITEQEQTVFDIEDILPDEISENSILDNSEQINVSINEDLLLFDNLAEGNYFEEVFDNERWEALLEIQELGAAELFELADQYDEMEGENDEEAELADATTAESLEEASPEVPQAAQVNVPLQPVVPVVVWTAPDNMVWIRGGSFVMGNPFMENERNQSLRHININSFYIGRYEVTQKEYEEVMGINPSYFRGPNLPVHNVNWYDAIEYCIRRSIQEGLTPVYRITGSRSSPVVTWNERANGYRLPTEAEWEYACRAGTTTLYNTGDRISRWRANFWSSGPVEVGRYRSNNWGLYDMHGNVSEWCWDLYITYSISSGNYSYEEAYLQTHRVFRGGSWANMSMRLRSSFRDHYYPSHKSTGIGFRVVVNGN